MAINKKLIHFNNFSNFNSKKLSANVENTKYTIGIEGSILNGEPEILYQSIVYIKDVLQLWTHGLIYDCSEGGSSDANVQAVDTSEILDDVETNTYVKYVAQTLTEEQKAQVRENIGVEENIDLSGYATKDDLNNKQDTLVSGSNIKTINGESILGSGDITIEKGTQVQSDWNEIDTTSPAYIANKPNIAYIGDDFLTLKGTDDGTKFLADDGTYKTLYTTTEIDNKLGDINTILESIING